MKEKRFFKLQILDSETKTNHVDEVLADNRITSHIDYAGQMFEHILPEDIFMIHKGNQPYCLAEVLYRITDSNEIKKGISFGIDYKIKKLGLFDDIPDSEKFKIDNQKVGPQGTFTYLFNESKTKKFVRDWYHFLNPKFSMKTATSILKHKKQIILQGPPGTGKTRLAKKIAEELTKEIKTLNPLNKVLSFFNNSTKPENTISQTVANKKLQDFYEAFPKEKINEILIDEYAIGTGENNTFCWWMEIGLKPLGYYFPGNAGSYRIYWSKKNDNYAVSGDLLKDKDENEAFTILKENLSKLANNKDYVAGRKIFTESFMLKILHSYYPEEYFPINSDGCMNNILKLFNIPNDNLNRIEKNKKIQAFFNTKKEEYNADFSSYDFMNYLFQEFDLKGTINFEGNEVIEKGDSKIIQFHPAYTYEDFVRGISVKSNANETIEYKTENRVLAEFAEIADKKKSSSYVLIIDEINRANLSSVLGELIYALEYRGESVESMYEIDGDRKITLPPNLYIIGTMNTADRSVGQIDYAIRRRFAFVDVLPKVLSETDLNADRKKDESKLLFKEDVFLKVKELFLNDNNENSEHLSEEFQAKDVQLGHSYFIYSEDNFKYNLEYEIKPILREYVTDGILKSSASPFIENL